MYLHYTHGAPAPLELIIWDLAKATGWTLPQIYSLSLVEWNEYLQIESARAKAGR